MTKLYLAIPCYNEEEVLRDSAEKLLNKYSTMMAEGKISADSRIVFIDDGSKDRTWEIISELHTENPIFQGIKLSRNRGHQNALLCGLMTLKDKADAVISIDADLQDDINTFDEMVAKYEDGCDVVYGVRSKRETDTFFKRFTAEGFYKILNHMGAKVIFNHADFSVVKKGEPVYLTKNGYGSMVVLSLEQYAALTDEVELRLDEADRAAELDPERYTEEEVFGRVRARINGR